MTPSPQLDAFEVATMQTPTRLTRGMVRGTDAIESQRASADVLPKLSEIQRLVMQSFAQYGPLNDRELESLPCFKGLAPSTARKRRSELVQMGRLVKVGRRDKMSLYDVAARQQQSEAA